MGPRKVKGVCFAPVEPSVSHPSDDDEQNIAPFGIYIYLVFFLIYYYICLT